MGLEKPTQLGPLQRLCFNHWTNPGRKKQLINSREHVSNVGDWSNITIEHLIAICAKHAHVKIIKKNKI
jgi:hypothetical protein